uniref:Gag1-like clamp domain-containing protein n=1 Tax=Cucumis melo TaxID=3656 RepID=A0A9I9CW71_CUCME
MEKTEINGGNPNLNGNGNHSSGDSKVALNGKSNEMPTFINHAEIAWHERRKEWVGDRSENVQREPKEPILRYSFSFKHPLFLFVEEGFIFNTVIFKFQFI